MAVSDDDEEDTMIRTATDRLQEINSDLMKTHQVFRDKGGRN